MNRTSWIIISVTAALSLGIGFFWTRPAIISDLQAYNQSNKADDDLTQTNRKKELLIQLKDNKQLKALDEIAGKYIPEEADSSELVLELTAMAEQSKLSVDSFSLENQKTPAPAAAEDPLAKNETKNPAGGTGPSGAQTIGFTIAVSGSFQDFMNFLKSSESSSRLLSINELKLSQTTSKDTLKFTAELGGEAYFKKGVSLTSDLDNIQISTATVAKFLNLKAYSAPLNLPTEAGFGRVNPFDAP